MATARKKARIPFEDWTLQTAKARFSEVFRLARSQGTQWITRGAKEEVVVLPAEEFERLTHRTRHTGSLADFFARSPWPVRN
jgi:prevent-host-death family protein